MEEVRYVRESRYIKSSHVLPPDTNCHGTLSRVLCDLDI
jgi:hypothetical protein